jgi:1,4-dihydroxy-2-naphthoate octaprenyltransferase
MSRVDSATRAPVAPPPGLAPRPAAAPDLRLRARAYFRMGRTIRYENWSGTPLWWCLLPAGVATAARTLVLVPLTLLVYMSMVAVTGTLDDVTGYRDGSDLENYARSDPTGKRPMTRKPLLLGWCSERQAVRYATLAATVCGLALTAAWLIGTREPAWWLPVAIVVVLIGFQYSAGLKLSYIGAQELTLFTIKVGSVALPYLLVTGHLPGRVAVAAAVLALWFVQVSMCSNTHDVDGDRAVGRRTLAVLVGEEAHRRAIAAVVAAGWVLMVTAAVAGWWSPWFLLGALPAGLLHVRQLRALFGDDPLTARNTGFQALRTGVLGLCIAGLLVV